MAMASRSRGLLVVTTFATTVAADGGDDFANNLFSDLAPLLALFGERVTMQFMSQSLGWADNIALAMVPLGIITIITSAIRVGGPSFLKALIGRARENLAVAEQELMSSTSKEVCELWNGHEIVRCMGSCPVTEFICLLPKSGMGDVVDVKVKNFSKVLEEQLIQTETNPARSKLGNSEVEEDGLKPKKPSSSTIIVTRNPHMDAPNISLNSHNRTSRFELRTVAVLGTILQLAVLVFAACAVYHPALTFLKDGSPVDGYAFPCNVAGTLLLVTGVLLCAHVVESSTSEETFQPSHHVNGQLVWLQQSKTVNDQMFDSFAIYARAERTVITTSRRLGKGSTTKDETYTFSSEFSDLPKKQQLISAPASVNSIAQAPPGAEASKDHELRSPERHIKAVLELKTSLGTFIGLCGFVVQFVGLRGLHWSASIAQLGAVLLMAGLRAWVRRGLAEPPRCQHVQPGFELDWFATTFADAKHAPWRPDGSITETGRWTLERLTATQTGFVCNDESQAGEKPNSGADRVVKIRRDLAQLASWHGPASVEAVAIARSIEATMDTLFPGKEVLNYTWALNSPTQGPVHFRLHRGNGKWQAYADELEAALSLWLFSVDKDENDDKIDRPDKLPIGDAQDDKWMRTKGLAAKNSLRVLGSYSQSLRRDLSWWIPHETTKIIRLTKTENNTDPAQILSVRNHRIVGSKESFQVSGKQTNFEVKDLLEPSFDGKDDEEESKDSDSENREHDIGGSTAAQRNDDYNQDFLAVEFNGSLKSLFAQDIFSSFLMAAAQTLERSSFKEPAEIQPNDNTSSQAWQSFTLRSDQLTKLGRTIQSTGLGSLDDIYLSIIPSFGAENKLPQVTRVLDLTRQHAKPHEKVQRWEEASDAYLWLFRVAKTFPEDNEFVPQAVAILVEFLRQVNSALDLCERLQDERRKSLQRLQEEIESKLRDGGRIEETYDHLLTLYTAQQRPWKGAVISQETGYKFPGTFNLTEMHRSVLTKGQYILPSDLGGNKRDLNTKDVLGWTPLHYAVHQPIQIELLFGDVESELAVNSQDLLGHTPLHYACGTKHEDQFAQSSIRTLLQWGAEINAQGRDGVAPIHCAARNGNLEATRLLAESGADIDIRDASGKTPLLWSVISGNQATVEYLWENANTKLRDGDGRTALHLAVVFADDETVRWLLKNGANAQAVDRRSRTPLHQIAQSGRVRSEAMGLLCQKDQADVNAKDGSGWTALKLAASNGYEALVKWLIEVGADVNAKDHMSWAPLHSAAISGHEAVVSWLIQAGADINTRNHLKKTALQLAAAYGHEAVVKRLIKEPELDINAGDYEGKTALQLAARKGHKAIVKWLFKAGADVGISDSRGRTASHLAAEALRERLIEEEEEEARASVDDRESE